MAAFVIYFYKLFVLSCLAQNVFKGTPMEIWKSAYMFPNMFLYAP